MLVAVLKETFPGEKRVALIPAEVTRLTKRKCEVIVEAGAGAAAGFLDAMYEAKGARVGSRADALAKAEVVVCVRALGANAATGAADAAALRAGQALIGFLDPLGSPKALQPVQGKGVHAFSMELMPRITRAQSMDALSSMANIAGYKAVLLAASALPKMFPMMITAAGTVSPAKVLVLGAGVAGLQAIATAKRLGAVVEAYDVRPEVKEQVVSVGGKFVELQLETAGAGDKGGYAKAQSEEFYKKQQEQLAQYVRAADVIITTAAIPGRRAPTLITAEMLKGSKPGAVLVDLAAETGGNCALTKPGETTVAEGVTILGPLNVPGTVPAHASQLYARNVVTFLEHLTTLEGTLKLDREDEITRETLVVHNGEVVHPRVQQALKG
jgi:NAD(P) transhydrogenase subunit alpha